MVKEKNIILSVVRIKKCVDVQEKKQYLFLPASAWRRILLRSKVRYQLLAWSLQYKLGVGFYRRDTQFYCLEVEYRDAWISKGEEFQQYEIFSLFRVGYKLEWIPDGIEYSKLCSTG